MLAEIALFLYCGAWPSKLKEMADLHESYQQQESFMHACFTFQGSWVRLDLCSVSLDELFFWPWTTVSGKRTAVDRLLGLRIAVDPLSDLKIAVDFIKDNTINRAQMMLRFFVLFC